MQSDNNQLYKLTAERTGKSEHMYKDLGNFVFGATAKALKKPKALIYKLKGVGRWYLRKKRMQHIVDNFNDRGTLTQEDFESVHTYENYIEKKERSDIFKERLKDYENYLQTKKEVRDKRNETGELVIPIDTPNERFKSD